MSKPVGYKVPPEHTRWKKGQSGNPTGRARGHRNLKTDLAAELMEIVEMTERGVPRRFTKQRALIRALTARAIGGDARATGLLLGLIMSQLDAGSQPQPPADLAADDEALLEAFLARRQNSGRKGQ